MIGAFMFAAAIAQVPVWAIVGARAKRNHPENWL